MIISNILRILSYLTAFIAGYTFFAFVILASFVTHIYIFPPFRLKRFPIIATFLIALCVLFCVLAGFVLESTNSILNFPEKLALFILFVFTFGLMIKDIKDYEGDRTQKIYTLPVIFGLEKGKTLIGLLLLFIYIFIPFIFLDHFKILIFPSILAGILALLFTAKRNYSDKPLFLIFFFYGFFFALTVF